MSEGVLIRRVPMNTDLTFSTLFRYIIFKSEVGERATNVLMTLGIIDTVTRFLIDESDIDNVQNMLSVAGLCVEIRDTDMGEYDKLFQFYARKARDGRKLS